MVFVLSLLLVVDLVPKVADEDALTALVFFRPFFRLALLFAAATEAAVLDGLPLVAAATFFGGLVAALVARALLRIPKTIAALTSVRGEPRGEKCQALSGQAHHSTVAALRYG